MKRQHLRAIVLLTSLAAVTAVVHEPAAAEAIGAGRWERSPERLTHRNGHRRRVWSTKAGDLELGIPKFRKGSFFPEILEPRRRIDQALYAVVMEAYVAYIASTTIRTARSRNSSGYFPGRR